MSTNQNSSVYGIVIGVLLLLSAGLGWFFWQKSQTMKAESEKQALEIAALSQEKSKIEMQLDSLSGAYSNLRTENENLQGKVTSTASRVEEKEIIIKKIRAQSSKDLNALRTAVADLEKAKTEMETIIKVLQDENAQLRAENERLSGENAQLKDEKDQLSGQVGDLAKKLEDQIRKTQSATFRATSFRVEPVRRNDKLSTKARRIREIYVSFDLTDVPEPFQGAQKLYMVITDEQGRPIPTANPAKATIYAPSGPVEIIAQQVKQANLEQTQRMSMNFKFDERLKSGNYVVAIYCDKGLLGASSFRLA